MYIDRRIDPYEDETDRDSICPTYVNWPINKTVIENGYWKQKSLNYNSWKLKQI